MQSGAYLPPGPTDVNIDSSSSSISGSGASIDEDDNDLTDNKVPQPEIQTQAPLLVQPQVQTVPQQTVTQVVNPPVATVVQKIKVRPRPAVRINSI